MKKYFISGIILSLLVIIYVPSEVNAETYVGLQTGFSFSNRIGDGKADADTNFNGKAGVGLLTGFDLSPTNLERSFAISGKVGHYFDRFPFLGVEGEVGYHKPDYKQQTFILTNPNLPPLFSLQETADVHDFQAGFSLMLRYPVFKRVMPYVGVGPQVHYVRIRGVGNATSGFNPSLPPNIVIEEDDLKRDDVTAGIQAKVGVRIVPIEKFERLAIDLEYKFNAAPVRFNSFRDLANVRGFYNTQQVGAAIVYRFGKLPQGLKKKYKLANKAGRIKYSTDYAFMSASNNAFLALNN